MTNGELDLLLVATMLLCAVMTVFNLVKNWHKGWVGIPLSASFLVFGGTVYLYRTGASNRLLDASCAVLVLLLGMDFFFRSGRPSAGKKR